MIADETEDVSEELIAPERVNIKLFVKAYFESPLNI